MAFINTPIESELESTYNALIKWVKQYITSGKLRSKFDVFEREEVVMGGGIEVNVILSAANQRKKTGGIQGGASTVPAKADEHKVYKPNVFTVLSKDRTPYQGAVTVSYSKLRLCVGNEEALRKYAAELTESLYQGWTNEKNANVAAVLNSLANSSIPNVTLSGSANTQELADSYLTNIKSSVEDIREGVTGDSYGNTEIGEDRIAAETVAIVMSNATAAMLDTYGYSKAFNEEYLKAGDVIRVTSNRVPENIALVTDARNIILHKRDENFVDIANSDGSHNLFLNIDYFIDLAAKVDNAGTADDNGIYPIEYTAFPAKIIKWDDAPTD